MDAGGESHGDGVNPQERTLCASVLGWRLEEHRAQVRSCSSSVINWCA